MAFFSYLIIKVYLSFTTKITQRSDEHVLVLVQLKDNIDNHVV